jgi:hypothetical protein
MHNMIPKMVVVWQRNLLQRHFLLILLLASLQRLFWTERHGIGYIDMDRRCALAQRLQIDVKMKEKHMTKALH